MFLAGSFQKVADRSFIRVSSVFHPWPDYLFSSRSNVTQVILKPRKARPFFGRHPWVLDSAIDRIQGSPADGNVVEPDLRQGQVHRPGDL